MACKLDESLIKNNQNVLIELFSKITLIGNEKVAMQVLEFRKMITELEQNQDYLIKLELQLAKIKNEMRKDLGLSKFSDLRNGLSLFATGYISQDLNKKRE